MIKIDPTFLVTGRLHSHVYVGSCMFQVSVSLDDHPEITGSAHSPSFMKLYTDLSYPATWWSWCSFPRAPDLAHKCID